jgi:hypothetical protein
MRIYIYEDGRRNRYTTHQVSLDGLKRTRVIGRELTQSKSIDLVFAKSDPRKPLRAVYSRTVIFDVPPELKRRVRG